MVYTESLKPLLSLASGQDIYLTQKLTQNLAIIHLSRTLRPRALKYKPVFILIWTNLSLSKLHSIIDQVGYKTMYVNGLHEKNILSFT